MPRPTQSAPDTPDRAERWFDVWLLALSAGLATGLGEAAVQAVSYGLRREHLFYNEHFLWMAPVAEAALFTACAAPLLLLKWRLPARWFLPASVGVLAFVGSLAVIVTPGYIYVWAAALLAAGIAWRLARWVQASPPTARRRCRRAAAVLVGVTGLAFVGVWSHQRDEDWRERRPTVAPPAGAPNVVLIVWDTVRADSVGCYSGVRDHTPFLNRLAGRSAVFERALAPSSWTLPSHASLFTGRPACDLTADWYVPLDGRDRTLAETLQAADYATGGFVANTKYCARGTGLRRGFAHYEDFSFGWGEILRHSTLLRLAERAGVKPTLWGVYDELGRKPARAVSAGFLEWIDRAGPQPFFAFLNYFDAHGPYLPERYPGTDRPLTPAEKRLMHDFPQADHETLRQQTPFAHACYQEMVNQLDRELERLVDALERRGLRENTVLIVTSDHGEHFAEHGLFFHGNSLYRPAVHVPLIVSWPARITAGQRQSAAVSLTDLGATLCDLLGRPDAPAFPGRSFWPEADASNPASAFCSVRPGPQAAPFRTAPVAKGTMFACLHSDTFLIREGDGEEHGYNFDDDPAERHELVHAPAASAAIAETRQVLDVFLRLRPDNK